MTPTQLKREYERLRRIQATATNETIKREAKEKADEIYSQIRYTFE